MPTTKLYHNESPLFHSSKAEHAGIVLFLDFNKKDILQGLYYTLTSDSDWGEELSNLAKVCENKSFAQLQKGLEEFEYKSDSFFDLPKFLLKEALAIYRGEVPALNHLKNSSAEDLICRCFGVYKNELLEVLDENPEFKDRELTNATKAGAGCSTCLVDFPEIFSEARVRQAKKLLEG